MSVPMSASDPESGTAIAPRAAEIATPAAALLTAGGIAAAFGVAACCGLPLMLAIIGGRPERFAPYVELYKRALEQY